MKYEENHSSNSKKFSTGLVITIACALLIVAGAAWFALSRYDSGDLPNSISEVESDMSSMYSEIKSDVNSATSEIASDFNSITSEITSDIKSEYNNMESSYNDTVSKNESIISQPLTSAEPTNEGVSSVPYNNFVFKMPVEGKILKKFSENELQYSKTYGDMRLHSGIDIACKKETAVSACADGRVLAIEKDGQYGNVITIEHQNDITSKYCSLNDIKVKEGDTVKVGDIIGTVTTIPAECNDEVHLHFEVYKNGIAVSPLEALGLE